MFDVLAHVGGFEFDTVVVEKRKADPALNDEARFYPEYASHLLQRVFERYSDPAERIVIVTDRLLGLNSRLRATEQEPVTMYIKDFDGNGFLEQIVSVYNQGALWAPWTFAAKVSARSRALRSTQAR